MDYPERLDALQQRVMAAKTQVRAATAEARGRWAQLRADAAAKREHIKATIDERTRQRDARPSTPSWRCTSWPICLACCAYRYGRSRRTGRPASPSWSRWLRPGPGCCASRVLILEEEAGWPDGRRADLGMDDAAPPARQGGGASSDGAMEEP